MDHPQKSSDTSGYPRGTTRDTSIEEPHLNLHDIKKIPANLHTVIKNGKEFKPLNLVNLNAQGLTNKYICLKELLESHEKPVPTTRSMIVNFFQMDMYATEVTANWNITQRELSPQITEAELQ